MAISGPEYQFIQEWVNQRSGVALSDRDRSVVEARLVQLVRQGKGVSVSDVLGKLQGGDANGLSGLALDALLPKETCFFRDNYPFELIRKEILRRLEQTRSSAKKLTIWCAGCSTGQEAYSMAIILHRYFPQLTRWDLEILATDLSETALQQAEEGRYDELEVHRGVPSGIVREYFTQDGPGRFRLKEEITNLVKVGQLNLVIDWPWVPNADIILMRNVLRYLTPVARKALLIKIKSALKPDGYLFLGAQESTVSIDPTYTIVAAEKTVYFQHATPPTTQQPGKKL